MRRIALAALSAVGLVGIAVAPADAMGLNGGLANGASNTGLTQEVARVCKEVCSHGVCSRRCVSEGPDFRRGYRDRGYVGRDYRDREVIERRDRRPGVEVDTPIGGVRVR